MSDLSCPACGSELDLAVLFANEHDQRALARLVSVGIPMGTRVLQYVALFTPPKQRLTAAKKIKLILQLLPDLERQAIAHKGRDWPAPLSAWAQAIDQMLDRRNAGTLDLPMKNHNYLFSILAGMADKAEASQEQAREQQLRAGPRAATTHGPASVAALVQQARPAATRPAPAAPQPGMSPTVRAMRAQIAQKKGAQ